MQNFYERLVRAMGIYDPHLAPLAQLTRLDPARVNHLQSALSWGNWPSATA